MNETTLGVTFQALLQGSSEMLRWQGFAGDLTVPGCTLSSGKIPEAACKIAAQMEPPRWENRPLKPVFTHMNGHHPGKAISPEPQNGTLRMPESYKSIEMGRQQYQTICNQLQAGMDVITADSAGVNDLLSLLEQWTSTIPAPGQEDISLFDQSKTAGALAACISGYELILPEDARQTLWSDPEKVYAEKMFLLYSADFSGIQNFIYTVSTTNALRSLRSRSFFLELLLEHFLDELLEGCGVTRANLLYSGGGHCYLLLPNTPQVIQTIQFWTETFNDWLTDQFGPLLYLADGWTACCANELMNRPAQDQPYKAAFRRVSSSIARMKMHRYTGKQLAKMNAAPGRSHERECRICGRSDRLKTDLCGWCALFESLSGDIQRKEVFLVGESKDKAPVFTLPARDGSLGFYFETPRDSWQLLRSDFQPVRIYAKAGAKAVPPGAIRLYVGDYSAGNQIEDLADNAEGVRRIAVCRMDVDNLGQAFVAGFEDPDAKDPVKAQRYVNITRTSAFSRQLSQFFKGYINQLLSGGFGNCKALQVSIVYSGGDDVFLVGAWTDVIEAATRIHNAFEEFSCGSLTISAGIGMFHDHYPIRLAASETAELEDAAKDVPGKNAVALFEASGAHIYGWTVFQEKVQGEKQTVLKDFFSGQKERGTAFLYRMLDLLRSAQDSPDGKLPLARYAYLLSRLEPSKKDPSWKTYRSFADQVYGWALNQEDRRQLITAIYIHVYQNRKEK